MQRTISGVVKDKGLLKILYTSARSCAPLESVDEEFLQFVEAEEGTLSAEMDFDFCDV